MGVVCNVIYIILISMNLYTKNKKNPALNNSQKNLNNSQKNLNNSQKNRIPDSLEDTTI